MHILRLKKALLVGCHNHVLFQSCDEDLALSKIIFGGITLKKSTWDFIQFCHSEM